MRLNWIENQYSVTELGREHGAEEHTHTYSRVQFIYWEREILNNSELKEAVQHYMNEEQERYTYHRLVTRHYRSQGYSLWDFSQKSSNDNHIDFVAKREREIILISAPSPSDDITVKDIKRFEVEKETFIKEHPIFSEYQIELQYNLSSFALTEDAFSYIQEHPQTISYQIIK